MNTKYRFKFEKTDRAKFTGHLDCLQTFQRAFKRADLPIAYSLGFNPHQKIDFAAPLSLGYVTVGDYGDFSLTADIDPKEVMDRLNAGLPKGLQVLDIKKLDEGVKNTMASLVAARYVAIFKENISKEEIENNLEGFLHQKEIFVMKKTKKGIKETDIKPDIIEVMPSISEETTGIEMMLNAGSVRNLKPESVAEAFCIFLGKEYNRYKMDFMRVEMYRMINEEIVPLKFGVESI